MTAEQDHQASENSDHSTQKIEIIPGYLGVFGTQTFVSSVDTPPQAMTSQDNQTKIEDQSKTNTLSRIRHAIGDVIFPKDYSVFGEILKKSDQPKQPKTTDTHQ